MTISLPQPVTGSIRDLVRVPGYRTFLAGSFIWHTTRWASLFATAYLLAGIGGSPLLNQAVCALVFLPMLLGGLAMGALSDLRDRRTLVLRTQLTLVPIEALLFVLVLTGLVEVWMTVPYMLLVGAGLLVNMTAQRAMLYELAGPALAATAMTLETTAQAAAVIMGTLANGVLIDAFGISAAFAAIACLLCLAAALTRRVPVPRAILVDAAPSLRRQLRTGRALLGRHPALLGMLAVTVVMNLFMFGYTPLIPIISKSFSESATVAGLLAAAAAVGQVVGGLGIAFRTIARRGVALLAGGAFSLTGLLAFAVSPTIGVAFAALFGAGLGSAAFASMQCLLALDETEPSERGVALGTVSTAIGFMPVGMVLIGVWSEWLGPRNALTWSAATGLLLLAVVALRWPELRTPRHQR
jgi:predicted MFS family arabinose efflux permease